VHYKALNRILLDKINIHQKLADGCFLLDLAILPKAIF